MTTSQILVIITVIVIFHKTPGLRHLHEWGLESKPFSGQALLLGFQCLTHLQSKWGTLKQQTYSNFLCCPPHLNASHG
jgi:hypothetical protein